MISAVTKQLQETKNQTCDVPIVDGHQWLNSKNLIWTLSRCKILEITKLNGSLFPSVEALNIGLELDWQIE